MGVIKWDVDYGFEFWVESNFYTIGKNVFCIVTSYLPRSMKYTVTILFLYQLKKSSKNQSSEKNSQSIT